jgi:DNA-binding transcriptional LysR family regulator
MKIDTLGVQAFIAIADHASFQKAAKALSISQTALTRRLQNLEATLGIRLVERTTRSVALTNIGQDFLPQARRLLTELSAALSEIREIGLAQRGDVCIACIPTAAVQFLPRIIREYAARFPSNRFKVLDRLSPGVTEAVLRREAELGLNIAEAHHPELDCVALLQDQFVLICRDDHPLATRKRLSWKLVRPHPLIFSAPATANRGLLDLALGAQGSSLQVYYEVQRSAAAIGMVAEGVAAAIVPQLAIQKHAYPNVRVITLTEPVISRTLVLVKRKAATLSPAAQSLYDLIRKRAIPR